MTGYSETVKSVTGAATSRESRESRFRVPDTFRTRLTGDPAAAFERIRFVDIVFDLLC
jgi:hypothetical protein